MSPLYFICVETQKSDELSSSDLGHSISELSEIAAELFRWLFKFAIYGLIDLIIFDVINVFTGWFDNVGTEAMGELWKFAALVVWVVVSLTKYVWNRMKGRKESCIKSF